MKDYERNKPLRAIAARDSHIELEDGRRIIDAMSSWWCKSLGHGHPRLQSALIKQMQKFEHIALADVTNETIVELSRKLAHLLPDLTRVFYASDGSSAVEIALKMSLHYRKIIGDNTKKRFIALSNSYHGETIGAASVSGIGIYNSFYKDLMFESYFIEDIPYVLSVNDPLWNDCSSVWARIEERLNEYAEEATALIVEPIVQAAGNMRIYSRDFLLRLSNWAKSKDVHLIADEIMTGFGRTGRLFACEHAGITPDFLCIGKGLTGGWLPLSAVVTSESIFQQFYLDYGSGKSFLHSHTFSGNALAAAVASEVIDIFEEEAVCKKSEKLGEVMLAFMHNIAAETGKLKNVRGIGAVVAADLTTDQPRAGYEVYQQAVKLGALLRPLGNTIYWTPPLNMGLDVAEQLARVTKQALMLTDF